MYWCLSGYHPPPFFRDFFGKSSLYRGEYSIVLYPLTECPVTPWGRFGRLQRDRLLGMKSSTEVEESGVPPVITRTGKISSDINMDLRFDKSLDLGIKPHYLSPSWT